MRRSLFIALFKFTLHPERHITGSSFEKKKKKGKKRGKAFNINDLALIVMDILCRDTLPSRALRDKLSFSSPLRMKGRMTEGPMSSQCLQQHTATHRTAHNVIKNNKLFVDLTCIVVDSLRGFRVRLISTYTSSGVSWLGWWVVDLLSHISAPTTARFYSSWCFTSSHLCWFFNKESQSDPAL